jgi:hypothetical protein
MELLPLLQLFYFGGTTVPFCRGLYLCKILSHQGDVVFSLIDSLFLIRYFIGIFIYQPPIRLFYLLVFIVLFLILSWIP